MTCVVSYEFDGKVYLGGDAFITSDDEVFTTIAAPKVYKIKNLGVGICGSVRTEQILERCLRRHLKKGQKVTLQYIQDVLVEKIRLEMKKCDILLASATGAAMPLSSMFIFALDGKAYILEDDFSLWTSSAPYNAIGAGSTVAKGAFEVLKGLGALSPEEKVTQALVAAGNICSQVRPPYTVICI